VKLSQSRRAPVVPRWCLSRKILYHLDHAFHNASPHSQGIVRFDESMIDGRSSWTRHFTATSLLARRFSF
jgi:hypothetical protein